MEPLKILSWNTNSIQNRLIEVQQFVLENSIDIVCLQETKHDKQSRITIPGYSYITKDSLTDKKADGTEIRYRGLITYYKKSIAANKCKNIMLGSGTQVLVLGIYDQKGRRLARIANTYSPACSLNLDSFDVEQQTDPLIIAGDLNAVHPKLGNKKGNKNVNGTKLFNYMSSESCNMRILNGQDATHIQGNKLDYICAVGNFDVQYHCEIVDTLTSDHYGIYAELQMNISFNTKIYPRKKLVVPKKHEDKIRRELDQWHNEYEPVTSDEYNADICNQVEKSINKYSANGIRTQPTPMKRWYNGDEAVKRINKQYIKSKKKWMKNPTNDNLTVFMRLEKQVQEVKLKSREKCWVSFLQTINHNTPQSKIAKNIRIVQGKTKKPPRHINPAGKAEELITQWSTASSTESLPLKVRAAVERRRRKSAEKLVKSLQEVGICDDKPITEEELQKCLKQGKSSSPGIDGITYNVIRFLTTIAGNPILKLYNMIWNGNPIPKAWKKAVIIPIPKPGKPGEFRPISLTSCLCKVFERIILNRLQHLIKNKLAKCIYGFIPGLSTQQCIHRVSAGIGQKYTMFIDLKGAFDKANHNIILTELAKMIKGTLLRLTKQYLEDRISCVYFEGSYSRWAHMELGTPQGGVISPTLFNVIMNVIGSMKLTGATLTIYADDIVIQSNSKENMKKAVNKFTNVCNSIGLVISPEKTKMLAAKERHPLTLTIQGRLIEKVNSYKYMGVVLTKYGSKWDEIKRIKDKITPRLALLWKVACGSVGATVPLVRQLYISMIRSIIDYSSSAIYPLRKTYVNSLEIIQNKAARAILGTPGCVRQEILREEAGLTTIKHRISLMAITQILRSVQAPDDGLTKEALTGNKRTNIKNPWIKAIQTLIKESTLEKYINLPDYGGFSLAPWKIPRLHLTLSSLEEKKEDTLPVLLRQDFYNRLEKLPHDSMQYYTDGSLFQDGRAGCGAVVYYGGTELRNISIRISNDCSTLQSELLGIAAALTLARDREKNIILATDSLSAIQSLTSKKNENETLVRRVLVLVTKLQETGREVHFIWTPSHCGILGNERADQLAREGAHKDIIDYHFPPPVSKLQNSVGRHVLQDYKEHVETMKQTHESVARYYRYTKGVPPLYTSKNLVTRKHQTTHSRLRLQYRYLWEVAPSPKLDSRCKLCRREEKHTLSHYLIECEELKSFRDRNSITDEKGALVALANPTQLLNVLLEHTDFARSR